MENIKITNTNGEEKEYVILFDYITTPNRDQYIVYTDFTKDENNIINCYSNILGRDGKLSKIEDEEQIKFIESTLRALADMSNLKYKINKKIEE